jgi:hypothetical protein
VRPFRGDQYAVFSGAGVQRPVGKRAVAYRVAAFFKRTPENGQCTLNHFLQADDVGIHLHQVVELLLLSLFSTCRIPGDDLHDGKLNNLLCRVIRRISLPKIIEFDYLQGPITHDTTTDIK